MRKPDTNLYRDHILGEHLEGKVAAYMSYSDRINKLFSETELLHALELEGYDTGYCVLDAYTLFHRGDGTRLFPKDVSEIYKQTYPSAIRSCDLNVYTFMMNSGKKGAFVSDSRGGEAVLGDSFFFKAKKSEL